MKRLHHLLRKCTLFLPQYECLKIIFFRTTSTRLQIYKKKPNIKKYRFKTFKKLSDFYIIIGLVWVSYSACFVSLAWCLVGNSLFLYVSLSIHIFHTHLPHRSSTHILSMCVILCHHLSLLHNYLFRNFKLPFPFLHRETSLMFNVRQKRFHKFNKLVLDI